MPEYNTKQREAILRFFENNGDKHYTAAEIESGLAAMGEKLGKATVYRRLDRLVDEGLVRRFVADDAKSCCYQYAGGDGCKNHFHLKCMSCGELMHIECDYLDEMKAHVLEHHGFMVDISKITICGVCEKCRNLKE